MIDIVLADEAWKDVDAGTEALVDAWLVQEGESVVKGQALANVVLVKTNHEIAAPADGVLEKILVPAEESFPRGAVLGILREHPAR